MLLSGDDLTQLSPKRLAMLKKMLPATGVCARFADEHFTVGEIRLRGKTRWVLFNWRDYPTSLIIPLARPTHLTDVWSDGDLGTYNSSFAIMLPARSARLIEATCPPTRTWASTGVPP